MLDIQVEHVKLVSVPFAGLVRLNILTSFAGDKSYEYSSKELDLAA